MKPGEVITASADVVINTDLSSIEISVSNSGDRPIQVGSHYHFFETNSKLKFDRNTVKGYRLDIPAGTAVRFEPGQTKSVKLVPVRGKRMIFGFNSKIMGDL